MEVTLQRVYALIGRPGHTPIDSDHCYTVYPSSLRDKGLDINPRPGSEIWGAQPGHARDATLTHTYSLLRPVKAGGTRQAVRLGDAEGFSVREGRLGVRQLALPCPSSSAVAVHPVREAARSRPDRSRHTPTHTMPWRWQHGAGVLSTSSKRARSYLRIADARTV